MTTTAADAAGMSEIFNIEVAGGETGTVLEKDGWLYDVELRIFEFARFERRVLEYELKDFHYRLEGTQKVQGSLQLAHQTAGARVWHSFLLSRVPLEEHLVDRLIRRDVKLPELDLSVMRSMVAKEHKDFIRCD